MSTGCSTVVPVVMSDPSVNLYWPPKPNPTKIKYLRDINGPEDIFPEKSRVQKFTEMLTGDNRVLLDLMTPSAVVVSDENIMYIADTFAGVIHRYDLESRDVSYIFNAGDEQLASPVALAVDQEQNLYVSDSINSKVYKFSSNGVFVSAMTPENGFKRPAGIAITTSGEKLVVDVLDNKLHKFSRNDLYLGEFLKISEKEELNTPSYVAVDRIGNIYLTDAMNFAVRLYDKNGNFIRRIGEVGDVPGSFARPKGIALDSENNIYVVDASHDNIQIFNKDGQLLLYFGENGAGPGQFYLPNGICIDRKDRIFIADTFNRRIQVFKFLKTGDKNE
jgi:sugar lactone lactonase YvrE